MPELPEVETVKETLKRKVLNKTIKDVRVIYPNIIENINSNEFINKLKNQTIIDITRRGKWLIFHLNDYYLLSHLRMEGKYFLKDSNEEITKHQHIIFDFTDNLSLRYNDTRKFGRMHLVEKDKLEESKPMQELGLEPWDNKLNKNYLKEKYKSKKLPIKTVILDQGIITGIGNIYADEILFGGGYIQTRIFADGNKCSKGRILHKNGNSLVYSNGFGKAIYRCITSPREQKDGCMDT